MNEVGVTDTNPIDFTAAVTQVSTGYEVHVLYGSTPVEELTDTFTEMPPTLTLSVTSSTVPSGFSLRAIGSGVWSSASSSSLSTTLALSGASPELFYFTVELYDSSGRRVAHDDPRIIVKKLSP